MMSGMLHEVEREEQTGDQGDVDERVGAEDDEVVMYSDRKV